MPEIRLQKYLSQAGVCSRRKGERFILEGRVTVNGEAITRLGVKIDPQLDRVAVDGSVVESRDKMVYIALNKPEGYVTSCDHPGEKIVLDLLSVDQRVYPVGRLDKDSTGLLLLTNDGGLHHRLSHPSFDHEKEYEVTVEKPIHGGALKKMKTGILLKGTRTRPARIQKLTPTKFRIILQEGRNRQIRRMVGKVGARVVHLKRIRIAGIYLGNLTKGSWRFLNPDEIDRLQAMINS
jgi:23S rRNA pseudouridine2605 synthase/23S rRNA pseudouridine2604 synthase